MDDLKIGDRVLSIENLPMSGITWGFLQELIEIRDTLKFTIQREGEIIGIDVLVHQDSFGAEP